MERFDFIYDEVRKELQLASISGGTDISGCFALGNPMGAVYAGELQCLGLGMKVEAFDENGHPVQGRQGELVCTSPSPAMPIYFWDDPGGEKYHAAYFDVYPGPFFTSSSATTRHRISDVPAPISNNLASR